MSSAQAATCDIGPYEFDYVGDVDCSGFVEAGDLTALLGYVAGAASPHCIYRGYVRCGPDTGTIDALFVVRHLGLPEHQRPMYCPDIGPDTPG